MIFGTQKISFKRRQDQLVDGSPWGDVFWLPFVDDVQFIKCGIVQVNKKLFRIEMDGRAHEFFSTLKEAKIHLAKNILLKKGC